MPSDTEQQVRDLALVATRLWVVVVPATLAVLCFSVPAFGGWGRMFGASVLIAMAAMLAGGVVGFLFGIPKSGPVPPPQPAAKDGEIPPPPPRGTIEIPGLRRNTNIEEISDWLTKIIVGLGIYELKEIPTHLHRLAWFLAQTYGDKPPYPYGVFGVVIAILFSCAGFLVGYLLTVLFMPGALQRADPTRRRHEELEQDATVARQLENMVGPGQAVPENIRQQVLGLCARYERERSSRLPGPERTNVMEDVTRDMRKLGLAAYAMLPELKNSESPGQRLAAIAFLCMRPDGDSLDWLAERIVFEAPFLKYQAAVALDRAASEPGLTAVDALKAAIAKSIKHLEGERQTATDEYRMLKTAEKKAAARV